VLVGSKDRLFALIKQKEYKMKLCKDCEFYRQSESRFSDICCHPEAEDEIEPVRGYRSFATCDDMRSCIECGNEGKLFLLKSGNSQ